MISWLSTVTLLGYSQPSYSQMKLPLPLPTLNVSTCQQLQLPASSVAASGFDSPNTPSNTLDNNLKTRWSNTGLPSSIQYNLAQSKTLQSTLHGIRVLRRTMLLQYPFQLMDLLLQIPSNFRAADQCA